ncbi:DMT family transporter [Porcipelethomonas sp.]|uniref:DMT family transporter n=1 Tax=Porcipelethomonas sp. TaxID=2981675 RepID=UPI003EFA2A0E
MKLKINKKYMGVILIITSAFCFALMNTFVRLSGDLPTIQKSFFRNFVAVIFAFAVLKKNKIPMKWNKGNLKFHLIRSTAGTIGILCNFYAIDHLVLSDASMLNKMSPFFSIIFSLIFLREKVTVTQSLLVSSAFIGSLFIIKPTFNGMEILPAVIGFIGGMGAGAAYTTVRYLGKRGEKGPFIVFFFSSFSCLVTLPYLIFNYQPMSIKQLIFLICAGLAAAGGQFSITAAYCYSPAKEISVYDYSQIIFAALLGYFLFDQIPDVYSFIGYIIIIISAIIMFIYNKNKDIKIKTDKL